MKFALKPILIGAVLGLVVAVVLFLLVASTGLGSSESAYSIRVLFPYGAVVTDLTDRGWIVLSFFVLQYPLYGGLLGIATSQVRYRMLILLVILTPIIGGHSAAFRSAHRADAIWVESQVWE